MKDCLKRGLYWVGFDFIGGVLTEMNVTSMACPKLFSHLGLKDDIVFPLWNYLKKMLIER